MKKSPRPVQSPHMARLLLPSVPSATRAHSTFHQHSKACSSLIKTEKTESTGHLFTCSTPQMVIAFLKRYRIQATLTLSGLCPHPTHQSLDICPSFPTSLLVLSTTVPCHGDPAPACLSPYIHAQSSVHNTHKHIRMHTNTNMPKYTHTDMHAHTCTYTTIHTKYVHITQYTHIYTCTH